MDIASSIKVEFVAAKLKGLIDTERTWPSSSSSLIVFCHLRKGRYQQYSTVLPLTQPEMPDLELFFYPQKFWRSPRTSSWRHGEGARCAACTRVCKLLGAGGWWGGDANRTSLFVCEEEWKHQGCYFSLVHGLKYGDSTQSTKNIFSDFKLRGTQLGQQTLKTLELERFFLLPNQSHTPKVHISCEFLGWIKQNHLHSLCGTYYHWHREVKHHS